MSEIRFSFLGIDCVLTVERYPANKQIALQLVADNTENNMEKGIYHGEPITIASVCITSFPFAANETAIKDYSENDGILEVLEYNQVIKQTGQFVQAGMASLPIVKVLVA